VIEAARSPTSGRSARRTIPPAMPALVGGGLRAKPGEISLAHNGVLFLDELPEFDARVLDSLRQPLETGEVAIARANQPRHLSGALHAGRRHEPVPLRGAPTSRISCASAAQRALRRRLSGRLSGPLLDRIDLHIEVPAVTAADLILPPPAEGSAQVRARVAVARTLQAERYGALGLTARTNAQASSSILENRRQARTGGLALPARGFRSHAPLGARLSPRAAGRPHARRSRRRRVGAAGALCGVAGVSGTDG